MTWRVLLKGLLMLASLALLGFLASHFKLSEMLSQHWIDNEVRGKGWSGYLLYLAVGALATGMSFPRQVVAFLGGYAFGFLPGTALSVLATVIGCTLDFYYARWLGRGFVRRRFPHRLAKLDAFLHLHPLTMTLVIRLLPVGHNTSTNLLAGVSSVRALPFFAGSALGYLPQNLVFALAGSGVNLDPTLRLTLASLLFVISSLIGIWLYRRHRQALAGVNDENGQPDEPR
jgi:uncharacterized membrane protein YdjX (TVP38/TMEM64 family)